MDLLSTRQSHPYLSKQRDPCICGVGGWTIRHVLDYQCQGTVLPCDYSMERWKQSIKFPPQVSNQCWNGKT